MTRIRLDPEAYRCPEHDNQDVVTALVRAEVDRVASAFAEKDSGTDFTVVVTCPGEGEESAHERTYEGKYWVAS